MRCRPSINATNSFTVKVAFIALKAVFLAFLVVFLTLGRLILAD